MSQFGMLQLVGQNQQNNILNIKPRISFFKKAYIANTPFFKYNTTLLDIPLIINKDTITYYKLTIDTTKGDLLSNITLNLEIKDGNPDMKQFIRGFVIGIIKEINLYIGGCLIEKLDNNIINIYNELWLKEAKRQYNDYLVGNKIVQGQTLFSVRLPFFFSRSYCKSLPLCSLKNNGVELEFMFRPINSIINLNYNSDNENINISTNNIINNNSNIYSNNFNMEIQLIGEFVILSYKEKHTFQKTNLEYLIELFSTVSFDPNNNNNNYNIICQSQCKYKSYENYITSEIYLLFQYLNDNKEAYNNEHNKYVDISNKTTMQLFMDYFIGFNEHNMNHYLIDQNIKYHSNIPRTKQYIPILDNFIVNEIKSNNLYNSNPELLNYKLQNAIDYFLVDENQYIYTHTFSLDPENSIQSTGGFNMSYYKGIDYSFKNIPQPIINKYSDENYKLHFIVYKKYYNTLIINGGIGILAF